MFRKYRRKSRQAEAEVKENKHWAREYILDPLTAPEPSQECGPGSTFIPPSRKSLEQSISSSRPLVELGSNIQRPLSNPSKAKRSTYSGFSSLSSPSSSRFSFEEVVSPCAESRYPNEPAQRPLLLSRSNSVSSTLPRKESINTKNHHGKRRSPPPLTHQSRSFGKYPPRTSVTRSRSASQLSNQPNSSFPPDISPPTQEMATPKPSLARSNSASTPSEVTGRPRRRSSLSQRYPGDMSHRPLDMIRRENRAADKAPRLKGPVVSDDERELGSKNPFADPKHKRKSSKKGFTDTIDRLDHTAFGGAYHHAGPYDAALAGRNTNPLYSPLEAVKDSNAEALRATPRDCIIDSATKHVPLQGTARVPPGVSHPRTGEVLDYEEGTDLMREPHAGGGPYKRWPGLRYLDEDLKGKGEPSYTIEKHMKEAKRSQRDRAYPPSAHANSSAYEMQPASASSSVRRSGSMRMSRKDLPAVNVRRRSNSVASDRDTARHRSVATGSSQAEGGSPSSKGGFGEGLKRRLGSLRRKN